MVNDRPGRYQRVRWLKCQGQRHVGMARQEASDCPFASRASRNTNRGFVVRLGIPMHQRMRGRGAECMLCMERVCSSLAKETNGRLYRDDCTGSLLDLDLAVSLSHILSEGRAQGGPREQKWVLLVGGEPPSLQTRQSVKATVSNGWKFLGIPGT